MARGSDGAFRWKHGLELASGAPDNSETSVGHASVFGNRGLELLELGEKPGTSEHDTGASWPVTRAPTLPTKAG